MKKTPKVTRTSSRRPARPTANALEIIDRITGDDQNLRTLIAEATINTKLAEMLYNARIKAGLTQSQLAQRVGTKQPVIARLEDADYAGHSLTMLQRIATALGQRIEIRLTPSRKLRSA